MGIYETTESRSFNSAMNRLVGTNGVVYSEQWPIHIQTGAEYMHAGHDNVGRVYANELLHNRVSPSSILALPVDHADLNNYQRALLTHLVESGSAREFDNTLRACLMGSALPTTAGIYFSKYIAPARTQHRGNRGLPLLDNAAMKIVPVGVLADGDTEMLGGASSEPTAVHVLQSGTDETRVEHAPEPGHISDSIQSPPRAPAVHLNPPGSVSRTVKLKPGSGKRRKSLA